MNKNLLKSAHNLVFVTKYKYEPVWLAHDPCHASQIRRDSQIH